MSSTPTVYRLDQNFVIKVADFGLSEDVYSRNYFRQTSKHQQDANLGVGEETAVKLPIKWMAMESLLDGIFTEKSDVVRMFSLLHSILCMHSQGLVTPKTSVTTGYNLDKSRVKTNQGQANSGRVWLMT